MTTLEYTMLMISMVSMGLVVLVFGLGAPWYKTLAGATIFGTKVSLFLILLILAWNEKHNEQTDVIALLSILVFPITTVASLAMLWLMIATQLFHHEEPTAEKLYLKHDAPHEVWDGVERRHQNLEANGHGKHLESTDIQE